MTNYTYRADGVKVKKLFGSIETHYVDGFQYKSVGSEIKLVIIPTSEGYYDAQRDAYFYNFTDHLGNVRVSYSDADGNGVIVGDILVKDCWGGNCSSYILPGEMEGMSNYYPFGLMHNSNYHDVNAAYQYKYNGKELQESGMYDYGARFYMPDLGRWGVVDPLAEISRRFTPYHYGNNNPVRFTDPDGRSALDGVKDSMPNIYSGWENTPGVNFGDWNNFSSASQFNAYIDAGGSGGGGSLWVEGVTSDNSIILGDLTDAWMSNNSTDYIISMSSELIDALYENEHMDAETAQKQQTKETILKDRVAKLKLKQRISGDDLKKIIPELKGIKYIEKMSATKFRVESTFLGSAMISDNAYLEIRPNSPIQGIGNLDGKPFSAKGVYIKVVGISGTASITVGDHKTQSFVVVGNKGMFKIGNKIIAFDL